MGKHEVGTPKYIANKIKAKGLQKLRWYCQMCQKQCRDENGFKCHTLSESHQRQLLLFADNSSKYLGQFSREFASGYLELLSRQYGTKRVLANRVYQEYINDRHHLHMNATQWETLTQFVKWLGREGKCVVDETEKGWFVTYIDRDPETIRQQEAMKKKEKMDKDDNERMLDFLEKQVEKGKQAAKNTEEPTPTELIRGENELISLNMNIVKKAEPVKLDLNTAVLSKTVASSKLLEKKTEKRKMTALDEIMEEQERHRKSQRKDFWLSENIVVKIITKSLGDKYYKEKGVVEEVIDKYGAVVKMLEGGSKVKLDQAHLETVIPAIGKSVKILNGGYRGLTADLLSINTDQFCANMKITSGPLRGKVIDKIPYEDFSKLFN